MSEKRPRPTGVWVFLFLNILVVMPLALTSIYSNFQDEYVADNPPYILAFAVASVVSTIGAWMGNRYSRAVMLALLTLVQLLLMFLAIAAVAGQLSVPPANRPPPLSVWLYFSIIGLVVVLGAVWLAANYWYFLGDRTRAFYSRRESA